MSNEICYWDSVKKELKGSQLSKARKFNKLKCIKEVGINIWNVLPIPEYNNTTYTVEKTRSAFNSNQYFWTCNCQHHCKTSRNCSHIFACMLFEKIKNGTVEE